MEIEALHSELPKSGLSLRCFIRGCHKPASQVTRFEFDGLVVQACLCGDCFALPIEAIIQGLTGSRNVTSLLLAKTA